MMRKTCLLLGLLMASLSVYSDGTPATEYLDLSKMEPAQQFRFLVGNWTYATANKQAHGNPSGSLYLDGKVISETVNGQFMDSSFIGQALYFYDEKTRLWTQTWSDSLGNVMKSSVSMSSYKESELPAMVGDVVFQGQKIRHIWYDITDNGYQTDLLVSPDDGVTYQLIRRMPYQKTD